MLGSHRVNTYQFVDNGRVDTATKRLIRSHVMKGRNTGKTVSRRSRLQLNKWPPVRHEASKSPSSAPGEESAVTKQDFIPPAAIPRNLGSAFLTIAFPVDLTNHSLGVISEYFEHVVEKLYPPRFGLSLAEANFMWLRVLLSDVTACHCSLSLMEACNGFFLGRGMSSPESLHHLSEAFVWVRRRLESSDALSDSTLGIILMLVLREQIRNEHDEAEVHYAGLTKMIALRGGLRQLEQNMPLLLKICKTDITHALQYGRSVLFFRDRMPEVRRKLEKKGFMTDSDLVTAANINARLDPALQQILIDISYITGLINHGLPPGSVDTTTFEEILISICSRLIRFHPLKSAGHKSNIDAAHHIAQTIFMMTMFLQHDRRRIVDNVLATKRLGVVLDHMTAGLNDDLLLWLMLIGGIWASGDADGDWIVQRLGALAKHSNISEWTEARNMIGVFPWIDALHNEPGQRLWNAAKQGRTR